MQGLDAPAVSYEEYLGWPETNLPVEFVDGHAIMTPAPGGPHQVAVARLANVFGTALPDGFEVVVSPIDWVISRIPLTVRQPDVALVTSSQARAPRLTEPPILAVEVVSPTSRERDLLVKRGQYATGGLAWYWLADLATPEVVVLRNDGGAFVTQAAATGTDLLTVDEPLAVEMRPADLVV